MIQVTNGSQPWTTGWESIPPRLKTFSRSSVRFGYQGPLPFGRILSILTITLAALENQKKIHHPNSLFPEAVVDMYCGDTHPTRKNLCRLQENPRNREGPLVTAFALSWVARGTFYNTYNMVLCPRFFQEKNSLESILHDMNDGKKSASNASEYKFSWGHTIYHELMHLDPVIAAEEVWDATYGACTVAKLANVNGCSNSQAPWIPPGWKSERGDPHTLINADSWAFFASGAYFQKAANLSEPGRPINDCGIYTGKNLANFTYPGTEYDPEGILLSTEDAPPDVMNLQVPPDPAPENTPPDDPSTPALPYKLSSLPNGLATPFNAEEYFATYVPAASSSVPPPASTTAPSASPPAYATGTCAFHLTETQRCEGDPKNLYAIVKLVDANKADIGDTPVNNDPFGAPINAADPYSFDSKLPHPIVIVGEHQHDYVQFKYGELFWQSKTPNGGAECNNGGWDPKEGPNCSPRFGNQPAVNNIDCSFPC